MHNVRNISPTITALLTSSYVCLNMVGFYMTSSSDAILDYVFEVLPRIIGLMLI